jgi:hypothetical protein
MQIANDDRIRESGSVEMAVGEKAHVGWSQPGKNNGSGAGPLSRVTLAAAGITKNLSASAQELAAVSLRHGQRPVARATRRRGGRLAKPMA